MPLLEAVPPVRGRVGRPRRRPGRLLADRGYDHDKYRRQVWAKGIKPVIARPARVRAGRPPLRRRAHHWPVALVPPLTHPLGNPRRHPRGVHDPRRSHHLLATPRPLILLRPLKAYAGSAPVTRASGRSISITHRTIKNDRLAGAGFVWASAASTNHEPAQAHYQRRRNQGDRHSAALRHLFNRMLGQLFHCLQTSQTYDPGKAFTPPRNMSN